MTMDDRPMHELGLHLCAFVFAASAALPARADPTPSAATTTDPATATAPAPAPAPALPQPAAKGTPTSAATKTDPAVATSVVPAAKGAPAGPRRPSIDLNWTYIPYGQNYIRAGHFVGVNFRFPIVQKPGPLWNTTSVTLGVKDTFVFTANFVSAFVEVVPIAFFKLNVEASHEYWFAGLFNGGFRLLTPLGRERLADGRTRRGDPNSVDWADTGQGRNNLDNFTPATSAHGLRVRITPTLQGQFGPVVVQYGFTADFVNFANAGRGPGDVFLDGRMFSLRKLRDWGFIHEANLGVLVPKIRDTVLAGATVKYTHLPSTKLANLFSGAFFFVKPRWRVIKGRMSFFAMGQLGANIIDPMFPRTFSWVAGIGTDVVLR